MTARTVIGRGHRGWRFSTNEGGSTRGQDGHVGFNPFRQQQRRTGDYVLVAAAFVVIALLVLWAFLG